MEGGLDWSEVKGVFERGLAAVQRRLESVEGPEYLRCQGRAQLLRELLNLPDIIAGERERKETK